MEVLLAFRYNGLMDELELVKMIADPILEVLKTMDVDLDEFPEIQILVNGQEEDDHLTMLLENYLQEQLEQMNTPRILH